MPSRKHSQLLLNVMLLSTGQLGILLFDVSSMGNQQLPFNVLCAMDIVSNLASQLFDVVSALANQLFDVVSALANQLFDVVSALASQLFDVVSPMFSVVNALDKQPFDVVSVLGNKLFDVVSQMGSQVTGWKIYTDTPHYHVEKDAEVNFDK